MITQRGVGGGWEEVGGGGQGGESLRHLLSLREEKACQVLIKTFTVRPKQKEQGEAPDWITSIPMGPVSWGGLNQTLQEAKGVSQVPCQ